MRLYYFTLARFALSNIARKRIKISDILALNDPFEFMSLNVQDEDLRKALRKSKAAIAAKSGLICFSRGWQHPMMWSHYADRHQGICLGFDVADKWVCKVEYVKERVNVSKEQILQKLVDGDHAKLLVSAKAEFWSYESEVRVFCSNEERDVNGYAFRNFDDDLVLREVIVGPNCDTSRRQVRQALAESNGSVQCFKARAAFGYFEVTRNLNDALWR